jgi:pyruvate carboxylase subunit B
MHIDGRRLNAEVVDERTRAIRAMTRAAAGPTGPKPVKAPMPGLVVRIEVAPGDAVRAGQGVLIMEAMKMENELKADSAGVVSRIHVAPGQAVEKGAVLIEFSADAAQDSSSAANG